MTSSRDLKKPFSLKRLVLSGQFLLYVFFSIIGATVLTVIATIGIKAIHNQGFLPHPETADQYECVSPKLRFSIFYLHDSDHIQITSQQGTLQGGLHQNQFDWPSLTEGAKTLGFYPPTEILFENAKTLHISGPDYSDVICTNIAQPRERKLEFN